MPSRMFKLLSRRSGKPVSEVKSCWDSAKLEAAGKCDINSDEYWPFVEGTTKRKLGMKVAESELATKDSSIVQWKPLRLSGVTQ